MALFDIVKNSIDNSTLDSKDIKGYYILENGEKIIKKEANMDLFFIEPDGLMKIIPAALDSADVDGMDRHLLICILESDYPESLYGLKTYDFFPRQNFRLLDYDNSRDIEIEVVDGRIKGIKETHSYTLWIKTAPKI